LKEIYGNDHEYIASCLEKLALYHNNAFEYDLALKNYNNALDIWKKNLGEKH
jgi:hypothetical protein